MRGLINSVQTRCIVKGEAQKSPLFWRFSAGFWFSQDRLFSRNSTRNPLNLIKSPIFTNAPCKTPCLYNAPSMHTVDLIRAIPSAGLSCYWKGAFVTSAFEPCFKGIWVSDSHMSWNGQTVTPQTVTWNSPIIRERLSGPHPRIRLALPSSERPPVLLGIPWPALKRPLRNQFWKKERPQGYWGGENSGNALEASNALNYRVWGTPAVLSTGIPGNALRAFPGSFRNFSGISSGKSQPYWGYGPPLRGQFGIEIF